MPSTSAKQAKFMAAVAHGWHPTGEKGPTQAQAQEFHEADKRVGKWEHPEKGQHVKRLAHALKGKR